MHALALLRINQQTKFEVPSYTISKDVMGQNFNEDAGICIHVSRT